MAQSLKSLPLFPGEPPSPPLRKSIVGGSHASKLWIAIHLPGLLETQTEQLQSLAAWARRLTPLVSLELPDALLLEVKGSLMLFGGLEPIKESLNKELERRRLKFYLCAAPTALAALWLARCRDEDVATPTELAGRLGRLALSATGWPTKIQALLEDLGLRTIGECLRLPRDGFTRRVGRQYLDDLDKALGKQFDARVTFKPPQRLSSMLELTSEVTEPAVLVNAGMRLIGDLVKMLRSYQAQVQSFELSFHHLHRPMTVERMSLADPSHEPERLSRLLVDRLERIDLPAPVIALSLRTGPIEALTLQKTTLFFDRNQTQPRASAGALIERLRGRFSVQQVFGVRLVAEHRPEAAWIKSTDALAQRSRSELLSSPWAGHRPLWILPSPLPLDTQSGEPCYESPLRLESGPERIETGWWDGQDISRDYYVAVAGKGEKLWVYRERFAERGWYLHGYFG